MNKPIIRTLIAVLLSALSGLLLFLAFPPYDLWPLMWVAFIPMIVAQYRIIPRKISSLTPAITVGGWLGGYLYPIFAGSGICKIRSMSSTDSGACRPLIPEHAVH